MIFGNSNKNLHYNLVKTLEPNAVLIESMKNLVSEGYKHLKTLQTQLCQKLFNCFI